MTSAPVRRVSRRRSASTASFDGADLCAGRSASSTTAWRRPSDPGCRRGSGSVPGAATTIPGGSSSRATRTSAEVPGRPDRPLVASPGHARPHVDEQLRILERRRRRRHHRGRPAPQARPRARPLRAKLGIDPTASDIHLGFAVVLRKLRQFQELGHVAVLIIGDFTAQVGDPSGKSATRPRLTRAEVDAHAATYIEQVQRILLPDQPRDPPQLRVARRDGHRGRAAPRLPHDRRPHARAQTTSPGATARARRSRSWSSCTRCSRAGTPSMVRADVELGGTDQLFNNLVGRTLQEQEGQEGQVVLTTPLLEGLDGVNKMSKSLGNYVGIAEPPGEQFGKLMSHARRAHAAVLPAHDRLAPRPGRRGDPALRDGELSPRSRPSGSSPARWWTSTTVRARGRRPKPSSTGCSAATTPPRRSPSTCSTPPSASTAGSASPTCCARPAWWPPTRRAGGKIAGGRCPPRRRGRHRPRRWPCPPRTSTA